MQIEIEDTKIRDSITQIATTQIDQLLAAPQYRSDRGSDAVEQIRSVVRAAVAAEIVAWRDQIRELVHEHAESITRQVVDDEVRAALKREASKMARQLELGAKP